MNAIVRWRKDSGVREIVLGEGFSYYVSEARVLDCFTQPAVREVV